MLHIGFNIPLHSENKLQNQKNNNLNEIQTHQNSINTVVGHAETLIKHQEKWICAAQRNQRNLRWIKHNLQEYIDLALNNKYLYKIQIFSYQRIN